MASNCAVVGCSNSYKILSKWRKTECDIHAGQLHCDCPCTVPFKMHSFPSSPTERLEWIKALQRKDFNAGKRSAVCSVHFLEGRPTSTNSVPTLHMGYNKKVIAGRRKLVKYPIQPKQNTKFCVGVSTTQADRNSINGTGDFIKIAPRPACRQNEEIAVDVSKEEFAAAITSEENSGTSINKNSQVVSVESLCAKCNALKIDTATQWEDLPVAASTLSKPISFDAATQWEDYTLLDHSNYIKKAGPTRIYWCPSENTAVYRDGYR